MIRRNQMTKKNRKYQADYIIHEEGYINGTGK